MRKTRKNSASPRLMRIKSLVFRKRSDAVAAIDKLKKGTDFNWLGSNAEGQVDPNAAGILKFDGQSDHTEQFA